MVLGEFKGRVGWLWLDCFLLSLLILPSKGGMDPGPYAAIETVRWNKETTGHGSRSGSSSSRHNISTVARAGLLHFNGLQQQQLQYYNGGIAAAEFQQQLYAKGEQQMCNTGVNGFAFQQQQWHSVASVTAE